MKILFVYNTKTTWTRNDLSILRSSHEVVDAFIENLGSIIKYSNPIVIYKQDIVVCWFASMSFLPIILIAKIFQKKIILFSGGYDGVSVPEINYGSFSKGHVSRFARTLMFKCALRIFCASQSYSNELRENVKIPNSRIVVNHLGFYPISIPLKPWKEREKIIVTIGGINRETFVRKGIKYFIDLASLLPDWKFFIIGRTTEEMTKIIEGMQKTNVVLTGFMNDTSMCDLLNRSKFYLQLSHHEAFGASVIDAALMGCYPIVYNKGSLKEVVDKEGSVFELNEIIQVKNEILYLENSEVKVEEKRRFYQEKYSMEKRASLILSTLEQI